MEQQQNSFVCSRLQTECSPTASVYEKTFLKPERKKASGELEQGEKATANERNASEMATKATFNGG